MYSHNNNNYHQNRKSIDWKNIDSSLARYFNKHELKYYSPQHASEARRKFIRWGKGLIKQGNFYDLLLLFKKDS